MENTGITDYDKFKERLDKRNADWDFAIYERTNANSHKTQMELDWQPCTSRYLYPALDKFVEDTQSVLKEGTFESFDIEKEFTDAIYAAHDEIAFYCISASYANHLDYRVRPYEHFRIALTGEDMAAKDCGLNYHTFERAEKASSAAKRLMSGEVSDDSEIVALFSDFEYSFREDDYKSYIKRKNIYSDANIWMKLGNTFLVSAAAFLDCFVSAFEDAVKGYNYSDDEIHDIAKQALQNVLNRLDVQQDGFKPYTEHDSAYNTLTNNLMSETCVHECVDRCFWLFLDMRKFADGKSLNERFHLYESSDFEKIAFDEWGCILTPEGKTCTTDDIFDLHKKYIENMESLPTRNNKDVYDDPNIAKADVLDCKLTIEKTPAVVNEMVDNIESRIGIAIAKASGNKRIKKAEKRLKVYKKLGYDIG